MDSLLIEQGFCTFRAVCKHSLYTIYTEHSVYTYTSSDANIWILFLVTEKKLTYWRCSTHVCIAVHNSIRVWYGCVIMFHFKCLRKGNSTFLPVVNTDHGTTGNVVLRELLSQTGHLGELGILNFRKSNACCPGFGWGGVDFLPGFSMRRVFILH